LAGWTGYVSVVGPPTLTGTEAVWSERGHDLSSLRSDPLEQIERIVEAAGR
jgi:hypothetical protein